MKMSRTVIRVENVSKQYRLGKIGSGTLLHDINRWWYTVRGKEDPYLKIGEVNDRTRAGSSDYVWALKDISFDINQGDVVGIIGRNGAGKSTLLKILSRTTLPTLGSIKIKGRIASLLEVGTGFHPELTGRQNIFLNGAILGMTKNEIRRKFDEIIDFSGVERYIDTPVKRYSSGMYVRLAFGVAAHLEPEILIVDEVLAVGDSDFQKKAIGKMQDVSRGEGRTVILVSHNMASIRNICEKVIVLDQGTLLCNTDTESAINFYLAAINTNTSLLADRKDRGGSGKIKFLSYKLYNGANKEVSEIISGDQVILEFKLKFLQKVKGSDLFFGITFLSNGQKVTGFYSDEMGYEFPNDEFDTITLIIPKLLLRAGRYQFNVNISEGTGAQRTLVDFIESAGFITVLPGDYWKTGSVNRSGIYTLMDGYLKQH
jgi:lipopolysaccharide transport system ATP-binding protein